MSALSLSLSGNYHDRHAFEAEEKHVSFQEKTYTIETDGTIGCAALKESKVVLLRHTTSLPLSFNDFGQHHCDEISTDSHEEEEHQSPADDENRLDCRSSYKKFAPRSKVAYVTKRASM